MRNNVAMWRVFEFRFGDRTEYIVSDRPMTEQEKDEAFKRTQFNFDLDDIGVNISYGVNLMMGCYSTESKERAEEVQKRLSSGESIWKITNFY